MTPLAVPGPGALKERISRDVDRAVRRGRNGLRYAAGTKRLKVGQTPKDVIWQQDKAQLWRYRGNEIRYRQPAHYGQTVAVSAWIDRLGSRLTRFGYEVRRGDALLATAASEHIWVERESRRPCRAPEVLREPFARLAGIDAAAVAAG